jgi:aryl-alcohol dehydrogenase-like predicted oxidoreductase
MLTRPFGTTGLTVSALGLGAGQVGTASLSEDAAAALLNGALDAGITLIDTAKGYGLSEERIGKHISHRRDLFVLSSKCGYGVPGVPDWTGPCITAGIDAALRVLRTDRIDIMHLHSCPIEVLKQGDVVNALGRARDAGKIRCAAYSGENEALQWAAASGQFQSLQTSVNICDQRSLRDVLPGAAKSGLGVIAKRPIANGFWRHAARPMGNYCETYWKRAKEMGLAGGTGAAGAPDADRVTWGNAPSISGGTAWDEFALRFSAFAPGVCTVIVGTASLEHLRHNAEVIGRGPLTVSVVDAMTARFDQYGKAWPGEV